MTKNSQLYPLQADNAFRLGKDSSLTTRMRSLKNEKDAERRIGSEDEQSARKKKPSWTRKILISLEKRIQNGSVRLHHRYTSFHRLNLHA